MKKFLFIGIILLGMLILTCNFLKTNIAKADYTYGLCEIEDSEFYFSNGNSVVLFEENDNQFVFNLNYVFYNYEFPLGDYYVADTSCNNIQGIYEVVLVEIYKYIFNPSQCNIFIYFFKNNSTQCFVISSSITDSDFSCLNTNNNITDSIAEILDKKINRINDFKVQNAVEIPSSPGGISCFSVPTFEIQIGETGNNEDMYTYASTDEVLDNYTYMGDSYLDENGKYVDDDITQLIPRRFFRQFTYMTIIGKEFGYFIETTDGDFGSYTSDVFLFDIEVEMPSFTSDSVKVRIIPLFYGRYTYLHKDMENMQNTWYNYANPAYESVVIPLQPRTPNLFITNIGFAMSVSNTNALNFGDENYSAYDDNGDFFVQTRYSLSGEYCLGDRQSLILDLSKFIFGFFDIPGTILNILDFTASMLDGLTNNVNNYYWGLNPVCLNGEFLINTLPMNALSQIDNYGGLIKTAYVFPAMGAEDDNPILIGVRTENNYIECIGLLNSRNINMINEVSDLSVGIRLDIVRDETNYLPGGWYAFQSLYHYDSAKAVYEYGTYQRYSAE